VEFECSILFGRLARILCAALPQANLDDYDYPRTDVPPLRRERGRERGTEITSFVSIPQKFKLLRECVTAWSEEWVDNYRGLFGGQPAWRALY